MTQRATLEEVAARAGVSRATASRVLRGATNVSEAARAAVHAAAHEVSYSPNRAARSLVTGRSDSIAFMVDETEERMFADPFFLGMLRSVQVATAAAGLQLVFTVVSRAEDRERFVAYAAGGHVDGVLLLSLHGTDDLPHRLEAEGVPTVLSGRPFDDARGLFYVDADNVGGGRIATAHLVDSGRRVVATVTGALDMCAGQDRLTGYRQAVTASGATLDESLVEPAGFTTAEGYAATERLLARRPDVDAIFAGSDLAAFGAIRALHAAGRRVPDDVAVVGFDDIRDAAEHQPPLSTVRQPVGALGSAMTRMLLARVTGAVPDPNVVLPVELVVRGTG
ncbi:LacI family DNA-binding transcriptional regulator [Nocardioides terrisoli]|uniref:LacI family DNA-binding transcriptional regulator n=1 Tax=Nocardioides terrisoli TaxID=3388267 RepID=UPI00287B9C34|nr:LacI family DNA-binding transcriptional regulator [Nocardioides marmorisolisilvae]